MHELYWHTVTGLLRQSLTTFMTASCFAPFRLVGGTALSLQIGHRLSADIDLFTDAPYGTLDFQAIDNYLRSEYAYVSTHDAGLIGLGHSYIIGADMQNAIKLDLYYTDPFIQPPLVTAGIRLATIEEIIAMKLDIIQRQGRKKDFWDIHALIDQYPVAKMLRLHEERYPYTHNPGQILRNFTDFALADDDFDPVCLHGKHWEIIKLEIAETIELHKP